MHTIENHIENGLIIVEKLITNGIGKAEIYDYIKKHHYEKVGHGIYASPDAWVDEAYLLHLRVPQAVFSHEEALYYHDLTDREPLQPTITTYTGYNTKRLCDDGIKVYTVKKELLEKGKILVQNNYGNMIPMYDIERTICDLVRSRSSIEIQDFQSAMKAYARRKEKDLNKLMGYAKLFRVDKIIRQYMEVLI